MTNARIQRNRIQLHIWLFFILIAILAVIGFIPTPLFATNPIVQENQQPGSGGWVLLKPADDITMQIKGYASATSVNQGDSITFYITVTPAQSYTIEIYRMGWYGGAGGRLMQEIGPVSGLQQPAVTLDPTTGLITAPWSPSYTLLVPADWTSGIYLAKLVNESDFDNYIPFVVRDDDRKGGFLFQSGATTSQAYNNFPDDNATGKSLYDINSFGPNTISGSASAVKASFNRPYAGHGDGEFFKWEYNLIRWLEKTGYDLVYSTSIDLHNNPARPLDFTAFLSSSHDEYWTKSMYDGIETARDAGVHLAFFGTSPIYWQTRLESDGVNPNRQMVVYRNGSLDPIADPALKTVQWRQLGRPEQTLVGIQYLSYAASANDNTDYIVTNRDHWAYSSTGFNNGDAVTGIVGYEIDSYQSEYPLPTNVSYTLLSSSPFVDADNRTLIAHSSLYQAPSGAWVFAAGTTSWSWALDKIGFVDTRLQRATQNILDRFLASQTTPTATANPNGTPTPTPTSTPTSALCSPGLSAEAESGVLYGGFAQVPDPLAGNGQAVLVPEGAGSLLAPDPAHRVDLCVTVATAGQYRIVAWALGPDDNSDSFFVQVDGQPAVAERWTVAAGPAYAANNAPLRPSLAAGEHIVTFLLREDGARLDRIELQFLGPPLSPTPTLTPVDTPTATSTLPAPTATPTVTGNEGACTPTPERACTYIYLPNVKR